MIPGWMWARWKRPMKTDDTGAVVALILFVVIVFLMTMAGF